MKRGILLFLGAMLLTAAAPCFAQDSAAALVGTDFPEFSLPSQQARLVQYKADYYGQHHLILTFFPAAFTPV